MTEDMISTLAHRLVRLLRRPGLVLCRTEGGLWHVVPKGNSSRRARAILDEPSIRSLVEAGWLVRGKDTARLTPMATSVCPANRPDRPHRHITWNGKPAATGSASRTLADRVWAEVRIHTHADAWEVAVNRFIADVERLATPHRVTVNWSAYLAASKPTGNLEEKYDAMEHLAAAKRRVQVLRDDLGKAQWDLLVSVFVDEWSMTRTARALGVPRKRVVQEVICAVRGLAEIYDEAGAPA